MPAGRDPIQRGDLSPPPRRVVTSRPLTVAETRSFLRQAASLWDEEDRAAFVDFIARNPATGDVIPDTGGIRKLRWRRSGSGKRGGVRVIYFYLDDSMPL